jgi:hypothetical protein
MGHSCREDMSHLRTYPRGVAELSTLLAKYGDPTGGEGVVHVWSALLLYATPACLFLALPLQAL